MIWIDRQEQLDEALQVMQRYPAIGVDTEVDSLHSYYDKVCLVQISTADEDFLIDPLAGVDLQQLRSLFADRAVTKILHAADYDLRILNRDFDITMVNIFDTMVCAQLLGIAQFGLAALLKRYFDVTLDKTHQLSDWSVRPLPAAMRRYAATDTHYLLPLAARMQQELEALGRWEWAREEFERLESIRFREKDEDEEGFRKLKGLSKLDRRTLGGVARLWEWRDTLARNLDRPPFKILGNEALISIAEQRPSTLEELKKIRGVSPFVLQKNGREILRHIAEVVAMPESELPQPVAAKPWLRDKPLERRVERLKRVRDAIAAELQIEPSVLAARHVLTAIATLEPTTVEQLESVSSLRRWQRELAGQRLVAALTEP